ncbi:BQ5605_C015g07942 [Microbotryum silenes-dioicae]|uniref:BQ5605_C015g07942 protein n=1 Tax=Microbotryum silenes-dioicae TaxID=796604 RepID=A0A2X0MEU3_9BASI|nr:BQ5605_C015g07942 [Microbotryum silenes-dioicae]
MGNDEPATPGSEQSIELGQDAQFVVLEEESTDGGIAEASNEIAPSEVPQDEKSTPATPRIRNVIELGEWDPSSPIRFDTTLPSPSTQPSEVAPSSDVHAEPQLSHVGMDAALRAALALPAATLEEQFGGVAAESAAASTLEPPSAHVASPEAEASNDASQQHFSGLGNIWAQLRAEAPRASMETTLPVQPAQETAQNLSPETQPTSEQTITTDAALTAIDVTMPPSSASLDALLDYVQVSDVVPTDLDTSLDVTPGISLQAAHVEAGPSTMVEVSPSTPEAGPSDSTASVVRANPPSSVTTGGVQGPTGLLTPDPDGYDRVPSHEDEEGEIEGEEEMQGQEDPFVEAPPGFKVVEEREQTLEVTEAPYESIESVAAEIHTELEHAPETARESSIIDEQDLAYFKARHHSEHLVIVDDDESIPTMSASVSIVSDDEEDEIEVEVDIEVDETIGDPESIDIDRAFEEIVASSPLKQSLPSDLDLDIGYRTQEDEFAGQALVRAEEEAEPALPTSEVPSMPAGEDEIPQDKSLADEAPSDEHLAEQPAAIKESSDHEAETPAPDEPGKLESLSFDAEEFEDYTLTEAFFPDAPDVIEAEEGVKDLLETGGPLRSTTPDYEPFTTTPEAEPFEYDGVEEGAEFSWDGEGDLELSEEEVGPEVINGLDEEHDFDLDAPLPTVEDPWTPEAEAHIDEAASSSDSEADEAVEGMLLSEADCVVKPEEQHVMEEEDELHSVAATVDDAESVHVHFASPIVPQEEETDAFIESASQDEPAHVEAEAVQMDDRAAVETSPASPKPSAETEEYSAATTKRHRSTRSKSPAKRARTSTPETDTTQSPRRISARLHPEALLPPIDISVPIPTLDQTPRLVTPDPTSQEPAVELTRRRSERNLRRSASVVTLRDPSPLPAVAAVEASAAPETDPSTPSSVRRSTRHTTPGSTATSKKRSRSDAEPEPKSEERGVGTSTSVTKSPAGGPKRRRGTPAPVSVAVEAPTTTPHPIAPRLHHHPSSSTVQRDEETMVDHPTTRAHCPFVQLEVQSREYPSAPPVVVNIPSVSSSLCLSRFLALADLRSLSPKCALSTPLAQETLRTFPIRQIDQLPPHPTLDDSVSRLGGQGHTTSTSHDPPESGSTHLSIEERDAELIRYPDVLDVLKKLAGGDLWHEGVVELVSGGGRRSLRGRSMDVEGAGGAEVGEVAMEKEEVASNRESKGASSGSATTTTRSLRKRK